jgi:hypothetical protein
MSGVRWISFGKVWLPARERRATPQLLSTSGLSPPRPLL